MGFLRAFRGYLELLDPKILRDPIEEQFHLEAAPRQLCKQPNLPAYPSQMEF